MDKITRTDEEWRRDLTPGQYRILRRHGTEPPGSSPLERETRPGTYHCAGCGQALFTADAKYHSGSGWPSFFQALPGSLETAPDHALPEPRAEIRCAACGGHLGHVFDDGPAPTGLRHCVNGGALRFHPEEE